MTYPRSLKARTEIQILTPLPLYPSQPRCSQCAPGQTHGGGRRADLSGTVLHRAGPPPLRLQGFYQAVARPCEAPNLQVTPLTCRASCAGSSEDTSEASERAGESRKGNKSRRCCCSSSHPNARGPPTANCVRFLSPPFPPCPQFHLLSSRHRL